MDTRKRKTAKNYDTKTKKRKSKTQSTKKSTKRSGRHTPTATGFPGSSELQQEYEVLSPRRNNVVSDPKQKRQKAVRALTNKTKLPSNNTKNHKKSSRQKATIVRCFSFDREVQPLN